MAGERRAAVGWHSVRVMSAADVLAMYDALPELE
jgi:hypothetical protein